MSIWEYILKNWILFIIAIAALWTLLFIIYAESKFDIESVEVQNKFIKAINRKTFINTKLFIAGKLFVFLIFILIDFMFNKETLIYWLFVLLFLDISNKILWRFYKKT